MQGLDFAFGLLDRGQVAVDHFDTQFSGVAFQPRDEFGVLDMVAHGGVHQRPRAIGTPREDLPRSHQRSMNIDVGQSLVASEANRHP